MIQLYGVIQLQMLYVSLFICFVLKKLIKTSITFFFFDKMVTGFSYCRDHLTIKTSARVCVCVFAGPDGHIPSHRFNELG